ncbi:hypothetical protein V9T40_002711 [Parthenolecanium corni]|uniref:Uncharacterized protein n=1 Tax=Parthenolecanium corni TaxID=536013 RepID=A0AAN9TL93_9HEMI
MCFLVHIGKPDILAVDWDDIVKRYQDEEKSESFASISDVDSPFRDISAIQSAASELQCMFEFHRKKSCNFL